MESYFSLQEILKAIQGRLINLSEDKRIFIHPSEICTDTRTIKKGDFFVALKGKKFDGNDFVLDAYKKGARAAIVNRPSLPLPDNFFVVQVNDTLKALQEIAKFYRERLSLPLIAITGSNGKTTVKELVAHILSGRYLIGKSFGNFNNQVGVPLSILKISPRHQAGVLELGMNQPGEIRMLSRIVQPNIGVITNVQRSHLGFFGSVKKIAQAKAEIIPFLNRDRNNYLVLNQDSPWVNFFQKQAICKIITFGIKKGGDFKAHNIQDRGERVKFDIVFHRENATIDLPLPGLFNVYNALAASAVCFILGLSLSEIKKAIETFSPPPLRCQIQRYGKYNILNDCYNANPDSMKSALCVLERLKGGRKIAILGDMLELGKDSASLHQSVGEFAASLKIDALFAYGRFSLDLVRGARKKGLKDTFFFKDKKDLLDKLLSYVNHGDWLLVKGSRETRMEELIEMLKNQ